MLKNFLTLDARISIIFGSGKTVKKREKAENSPSQIKIRSQKLSI